MATVSVRYIVDDVDDAIEFYCQQAGGGQAMPDGTVPTPGGWNRFALEVTDLDARVEALRGAGARFRSDIVNGVGGRQIIVDDPSGNPVELFEPSRPEARLGTG
jgi:catechol 2,3-dioxygenase-like lactoylglutathione lyase family enzyme